MPTAPGEARDGHAMSEQDSEGVAAPPAAGWCFADCELDLRVRELRRGGEVVAVEPRVFLLLRDGHLDKAAASLAELGLQEGRDTREPWRHELIALNAELCLARGQFPEATEGF